MPQPLALPNNSSHPSLDGILRCYRLARHQTSPMKPNLNVFMELKMLNLFQSKILISFSNLQLLLMNLFYLHIPLFFSRVRYKIKIKVEFDNHVGCFVFWDKDCILYINITARELRQLMREVIKFVIHDHYL